MAEPSDDADYLASLPPLVHAAAVGDIGSVRAGLTEGASPNEHDDSGWTALHAAATRGHPAVVAVLLGAGADVDARSEGMTPLLNAAGPTPSGDVIRLLLEAGADPNAADERFGWTPLSRAADYGNEDAAALLIEFGADVHHNDPEGFSLLMTAAEAGSEGVVRHLLLAGADPTAKCEGKTAADLAALHSHDDLARLLQSDIVT